MQIDIRPEVNILGVLSHLNYKPWFALAEFVDNSLASILSARASGSYDKSQIKLTVRISIDSSNKRITIEDNAYGISVQDFPRAFRAAEVPPDRSGLSEFGMGMKSAASWFANRWSVRTSVMGEPIQRSVYFDLGSILEDGTGALPVVEETALPMSHFTVVQLDELNHLPQGRTITKIKSHLTSIYRKFLRSGVMDLYFNDEPLGFKEVRPLVAGAYNVDETDDRIWRKDGIVIDLVDGRRVEGFAALRAVGSTSEAGFALFRRGRLIVGSYDETYRPVDIFGRSNSYTYQRLYGEFDIVGFNVSHTKDGIQWNELEEEFLAALKKELESPPLNLLSQAEGYRTKRPKNTELEVITEAAEQVTNLLRDRLDAVLNSTADEALDDSYLAASLASSGADDIIRKIGVRSDTGLWLVQLTMTMDANQQDWLEVGADTEGTDPKTGEECINLEVRISFGHSFTREFVGANGENSMALIVFGCSVAIALSLGKRAGARSQYVLNYLNTILRGSFNVASNGVLE